VARITIEDFDVAKHPNPMGWVDNGQAERKTRVGNLVPYKVCIVDVCGFRFVFHSVMQVELCLDYYRLEHRPSSRLPVETGLYGGDHSETQRWFERLPSWLLEKAKRPLVVEALARALVEYAKHPSARTGTPKPPLFG
jgi:hypothetical protein